MASDKKSLAFTLRPGTVADAPSCGAVLFEAFRDIYSRSGVEQLYDSEASAGVRAAQLLGNPDLVSVIAESNGKVLGSCFLDGRSEIRALGPITVVPDSQKSGVGRAMTESALKSCDGARGVRLLQDSFNLSSLGLYASLGFEVRETVAVIGGRISGNVASELAPRAMQSSDLDSADALYQKVHGYSRRTELKQQLENKTATGVFDGPTLRAFCSGENLIVGFSVAADVAAMKSLIEARALRAGGEVAFLLPLPQTEIFHWALSRGLRILKTMHYLTRGFYQFPTAPYFPSMLQ